MKTALPFLHSSITVSMFNYTKSFPNDKALTAMTSNTDDCTMLLSVDQADHLATSFVMCFVFVFSV